MKKSERRAEKKQARDWFRNEVLGDLRSVQKGLTELSHLVAHPSVSALVSVVLFGQSFYDDRPQPFLWGQSAWLKPGEQRQFTMEHTPWLIGKGATVLVQGALLRSVVVGDREMLPSNSTVPFVLLTEPVSIGVWVRIVVKCMELPP